MQSSGIVTETILFNTDIEHKLWYRNYENLADELLRVRIDKDTLKFIKHDAWVDSSTYYAIISADTVHGSFEIELPLIECTEDVLLYLKVRSMLISHARSLINKRFKSEE